MNVFDIAILVVMAIGLCFGLYHGFVKELVGTIGFFVSVILARVAIPYGKPYVSGFISDDVLARAVVWVVVFVLLMLLLSWLASLLSKLLDAIELGWLNRLAGGFLGWLKYSVVAYLIIWVLEAITDKTDLFGIGKLISESNLVSVLHKVFDLCCSLF